MTKLIEIDSPKYGVVNAIVDFDLELPRKLYLSHGYPAMKINGLPVYLHRFVMDAKEGQKVDHINRNKLDNRKDNLRFVTQKQNKQNVKHKGCTWNKGRNKWQVQVQKDKKVHYVGLFTSEEEAIQAYRDKHIELFGEYSPWKELI